MAFLLQSGIICLKGVLVIFKEESDEIRSVPPAVFFEKTALKIFGEFLEHTSEWVLLMWQHSKKILVEVNPRQSWPWKQNGTTVVPAVMIFEVVNDWRSALQINILKKKLDFEP